MCCAIKLVPDASVVNDSDSTDVCCTLWIGVVCRYEDEMDRRIRELTIELNNDNVFYIVNVNVQQLEDGVQDIVKNIRELEDEQQLEDIDGGYV
ncbi:hypothetical protein Q3G72_025306 [Acer saccharum]|nr:hypothetical protein Q3G72_025306 [Acer saccharum]